MRRRQKMRAQDPNALTDTDSDTDEEGVSDGEEEVNGVEEQLESPKGGSRYSLTDMQKWFSLNKRINRRISPRQRLERKSFRNMETRDATTSLGTSPLLRQLGEGLLKLLLAYGGYLLAPHLRELLYGHFGRPANRLDRAWGWLQKRMAEVAEAGVPETAKPTTADGGGGGEERLLEELRKNRELLEEQQRRLQRLSAEQERTADQLR
jgi:hypothetical protein